MAPATTAAPSALRRWMAIAVLLAAAAPLLASAAGYGGQEGVLAPRQGFWHYTMLEDEASATAEVGRRAAFAFAAVLAPCPQPPQGELGHPQKTAATELALPNPWPNLFSSIPLIPSPFRS